MVCENCVEDEAYKQEHSGCRANEATCIDGRDCPDFVEYCDCPYCNYAGITILDEESVE